MTPAAMREAGIEAEYTDIWGRTHATSDETARAILASLHVKPEIEKWSRPLDPALVVREDCEAIVARLPAERAGASVELEIHWEGGELEHHSFRLPDLRTVETANLDGRQFIAKHFPLPRPLRLGYHRIQMYWMKTPEIEAFARARFIVCPRRALAMEGRLAGIALSLYGLRSSRNWGCGDFTDLRTAIDSFAPAGAAFIALNPLHAIPNRQPFNTSPYLPECSLYRNFIYLDVERVGHCDFDRTEAEALRASEFVEYERVARMKLRSLHEIFAKFPGEGGSPEFDRYAEAEGLPLRNYAAYCALREEMHRCDPNLWPWTDWPEEFRDPRSPEVAKFAQEHRESVLFYKFIQWHIDRQLADVQSHALGRGMRIGLYHDLALATDRFGADLWANGEFYVSGCRVGAPPDDFSPNGQDWSFPPPNRDAHRENGYELFAQSIRKNARHGGALRIDHVMRFFRLYWIPEGMDAAHGAYVRDYADDLLGVLALESVREKFIVIGEDLGTVTDEVRHALEQAGILSYRVLWFERHADGSFKRPEEYPAQAAATTSTHDLPTLAGFADGIDIQARRSAGLIDDEAYREQVSARRTDVARLNEALRDAGFENDPVTFLLSTPCQIAIVNQEDLTGETGQQNLPGSTWQHPNWRRKMKVVVEDFAPLAEKFKNAVELSGRWASPRESRRS
ncbi:MAG: 4-alpha-glucanotransferase [Bryobacteraceae bacterium]